MTAAHCMMSHFDYGILELNDLCDWSHLRYHWALQMYIAVTQTISFVLVIIPESTELCVAIKQYECD